MNELMFLIFWIINSDAAFISLSQRFLIHNVKLVFLNSNCVNSITNYWMENPAIQKFVLSMWIMETVRKFVDLLYFHKLSNFSIIDILPY